ncbi:predicted protein [Uncinocarpus reesii 1704]|uniref:Uncharacterized protein n=1 Tax=Uncinocarpus reesii (strain UAMH 1704) TaxID=336963 RepID=C4JJV7_UNCRE|nr:uncharacterized protein UREG_01914 [Uncinocarpus reesii 1704]EEP77065.1 predicted protein [Uncinocarpus reesii 1704]
MSPLRKRVVSQPTLQPISPLVSPQTSQPVSQPDSLPPPSQSSSSAAALNHATSAKSAAALQTRIEEAFQRMEQANKALSEPLTQSSCDKLCRKIKRLFRNFFDPSARRSADLASNIHNDEQHLAIVLRRRTSEGINLTYPKVQTLTGDGKIPRKPSPFQLELTAELIMEKNNRRRSAIGSRDYGCFLSTGELDETPDETDELIYNNSQSERDQAHIEGLLSELSSELPQSITSPFPIETDIQGNWVSHGGPSTEPQPRRLSNFFENFRPSSPMSQASSRPRTPASLKGKQRAEGSPVPSISESPPSLERQRPASPYRLGRIRQEGRADFNKFA